MTADIVAISPAQAQSTLNTLSLWGVLENETEFSNILSVMSFHCAARALCCVRAHSHSALLFNAHMTKNRAQ